MRIIPRLLNEHTEIRDLIQGYLNARTREDRRERYWKVRVETTAHHRAEEKVLFNRTKDLAVLRDESLESLEEHHLLDVIMYEMDPLDVENDRFEAKFKVFHEFLEQHFQEEEKEQFPKMEKAVSQDDLAKWGREYDELEDAVKDFMKERKPEKAPA